MNILISLRTLCTGAKSKICPFIESELKCSILSYTWCHNLDFKRENSYTFFSESFVFSTKIQIIDLASFHRGPFLRQNSIFAPLCMICAARRVGSTKLTRAHWHSVSLLSSYSPLEYICHLTSSLDSRHTSSFLNCNHEFVSWSYK